MRQLETDMKPNLYRIIVLHGGPKDSHTSTETYLIADNEEAVFAWIDKKNFKVWSGRDEDDLRTDEDTDTEVPFKDWVMKKRGDLDDEEGWEDAYYGITKWGWEPVEASPEDIQTVLKLGIAVSAEKP